MAERKPRALKSSSEGIGLLRGRLAAPELARIEKIAERGPRALLAHAMDLDARKAAAESGLRTADRREDAHPNLAALTERVAAQVFRIELECEVALAVLRTRWLGKELDVDAVVHLARSPGRWSRRVEAFLLLGASQQRADACLEGARPDQHRWVQVAAIEALAQVDEAAALRLVRARFAAAVGRNGDDFLVRERLVDLAARRGDAWGAIIAGAADDASEHVRLTVARSERDPIRLAQMTARDPSDKVRTMALLSLAKRTGAGAAPTALQVLEHESAPLVVEAAAETLVSLARRKVLERWKSAEKALARAAVRSELPLRTRTAILEELSALSVLADPYLRIIHDMIEKAIAHAPLGGGVQIAGKGFASVTDEHMGRVLSVLSRRDFALSAERVGDGYIIYRGEIRGFAWWRTWFEMTHPLPSKRQGYTHTWARRMRGKLRAPPQGLAELSATSVPGERVLVGKRGDWGRHVPLVDDLIGAGVFSAKPTRIVGPTGTTLVKPADTFVARLTAWAKLSRHYARFAEQRCRSLESNEPIAQRAFVESVRHETGIRIDFVPHPFAAALPPPPELAPALDSHAPIAIRATASAALMAFPGIQGFEGIVRDLLHYAVRPEGNRLPHVGAYAAAILVGMTARAVLQRRRVDADRQAIPLVVGGWGTRGKSGTERLKAGLFHGLGYEVLVKTTGCEAMFIHGIPGLRAHEIFIHRPYDKATVWEQRALLRLARRFGVQAFLWECMALSPELVNLLQAQWMRDDYSTITNAFSDHEDVQGPAGYDVAEVISEFVPTGGHLVTTEDQMLPLLRERAKERKTSVRAVSEREATLIGDDVLARFPYHEHPKNVALVAALAQSLGIPASVALAEMADHVVPDLGVLRTYPRIEHAGRSLAFTNGMSANERTGALSNWVRMGFAQHEADDDPARFIITVVNNRNDRVARSDVFARFIVRDIAAHKHVLIGTNVAGLLAFTRKALSAFLAETSLTRDLDVQGRSETVQREIVRGRLKKAWSRLKIGSTDPRAAANELAQLGLPSLDIAWLAAMLTPSGPDETVDAGTRAVDSLVPATYPAEARPFVVASLANRRAAAAVDLAVSAYLASDPARLERIFAETYRALFEARLLPIDDSDPTGDRLIDIIARCAPPGARVDIMGLQNIKGAGLDFVYRWVSIDRVEQALAKVRGASSDIRDEGLRELLAHDDWGLVDSAHALRALEPLRGHVHPTAALDAVIARIRTAAASQGEPSTTRASRSLGKILGGAFGKAFDYLDAIRRQRRATRILDDLVAHRISHAAASAELRAIVARAKATPSRR